MKEEVPLAPKKAEILPKQVTGKVAIAPPRPSPGVSPGPTKT